MSGSNLQMIPLAIWSDFGQNQRPRMVSPSQLHPDLSAGVHELRGALADMLGSVGADVRKPQELARRLSLDKNLAWKLSRVVGAGDAQDALQFMPGDVGLGIVLKAVHAAGGAEAHRRRAEGAIKNFQAAVLRHLGDRPTLDLFVDGLASQSGERLSVSRKLAFRGNSGICGVQAKARINTVFLAPNRDRPEMMDCVLIGGWTDFRRIRSDARWVVFRRQLMNERAGGSGDEPLDRDVDPNGLMLMKDFCSANMPEIHTFAENGMQLDELGASTIGNSGAFNFFFGSATRQIGSRYAEAPDDTAQFRATISAPVEMLQFDLLIHRSCAFALNQTLKTYHGFSVWPAPLAERDSLPIHAEQTDMGREPPSVQSPLYPRYVELTERVFNRMVWNRHEFIGVRYMMEYPPFPSTVVVSFPLDKRADAADSTATPASAG
jgi:hypothetical protein